MSIAFINILDHAIELLQKNEPIPKILDRFPDQTKDLESLLLTAEALGSMPPIESPGSEEMKADRSKFCACIDQQEKRRVSPRPKVGLKDWVGSIIPLSNIGKEKHKMKLLFARTFIAFALIFSTVIGTYAMAESSLPNSALYGAKLTLEQFQLSMTTDPVSIASRYVSMANNRIKEVLRLAAKGSPPDTGTMTRLETQLNNCLQAAAQLGNDHEMLGILTQAQAMVQERLKEMNQLQIKGDGPVGESLRITLRLLNQFQNQVAAGIQNLESFNWQHQNGLLGVSTNPGKNPDCPHCPCVDCEQDGNGNMFGQNKEDPAEILLGEIEDAAGECVPAGDENKYGQSEEGPPGSPGGNSECPSEDCVPSGDENKFGQSDESPPANHGEETDCTSEDCEPIGDEYKHGQTDEGGPGGPGDNEDCPNCPCEDCEPSGNQYGPEEAPGDQGGNTECPCDDCVPDGDPNQNGPKNN